VNNHETGLSGWKCSFLFSIFLFSLYIFRKEKYRLSALNTELARVVDIMVARAKRIYISKININKLLSFSSSRCFLKEIENVYSVFLSSYRNTRESLGELEKPVETPTWDRVPTAFLVLPNFHSCFYLTIRLRARVFCKQILNEAQPGWLSLVENEDKYSNCFSINLQWSHYIKM